MTPTAQTTHGRAPRRVRVALLALVQALVLAAAPLVDPPPAVDHAVHLAAGSDGGCGPVHDDFHCVVCRVAAGDRLAGRSDAARAPLACVAAAAPAATERPSSLHRHATPDQPRAPPRV